MGVEEVEALGMIVGGEGEGNFCFHSTILFVYPRSDKGDVVYIDALFVLNILIKIFTTTGVPFIIYL